VGGEERSYIEPRQVHDAAGRILWHGGWADKRCRISDAVLPAASQAVRGVEPSEKFASTVMGSHCRHLSKYARIARPDHPQTAKIIRTVSASMDDGARTIARMLATRWERTMRGVIVGAIWIGMGFLITQLIAATLEQSRTASQVEQQQPPGPEISRSQVEQVGNRPK
jgi:hypothetical protein